MKDERIQLTSNRFAASVFLIWYYLLSISLVYRTFILKQPPSQWWDIAAIWLIGVFFLFIVYAGKGVFDHCLKRLALTIGITVIVVNTALFYLLGQIHSIRELGAFLLGVIPSVGLVFAAAYLLNRRWKQKQGLDEDEKQGDSIC
jgi:hypothetical protein